MSDRKEEREGADSGGLRAEEAEELFKLAWGAGDYARARHWAERGADARRLLAEADAWRGPSDPLCQAIESEEWELARLISFRVKERSGFDGKTALMLCAQRPGREEARGLAMELIAAGAPLWWSDDSGMDALSLASRCGNEAVVKALLRGARESGELGERREQVSQALRHGSVLKGHFTAAIAWELLSAGADPDAPGAPRGESARESIMAHEAGRRGELLGVLKAFEEREALSRAGLGGQAPRPGPRL